MTTLLTPKRILIWQTAFLGDLVLTLPLLYRLRHQFPQAHLTILTRPIGSELFKLFPIIDQVLLFDRKTTSTFSLIKSFWKKFDLAISPHRSLRASWVLFSARIPIRIGFEHASGAWFYTYQVPHFFDGTHEIERNLALLRPIAHCSAFAPTLFPPYQGPSQIPTQWKPKSYILCAPSSQWETKKWGIEKYADLIKTLLKNNWASHIGILGAQEDKKDCTTVYRALSPSAQKNTTLFLGLPFKKLFPLIQKAALLFSNDSAPTHIATALNTPVITFFGPTVPRFGFFPYKNGKAIESSLKLSCRPCHIHGPNQCPLQTHACMKTISVKSALKEAHALLKNNK